ncbi:hypothetical protein ETA_29900 [Erwinia tasmaniensis Et1/99]|uniref:Uncharacterized protein n=1 Tax=Erwinia tasmaniensis (strain DSM 17950 / CFBP 7177 / CIP 109463 / NCPPB 4357 / Et1/99) TaxID=465817 RepID=B2VCT2_ERWT9|nr:hypothetical protein ETA_29900 [Erwinia tasmaniensis Et1/99]
MALLQPFGQQAQAVAGRPEQFYLIATAAAEDEGVAGRQVVFQRSYEIIMYDIKRRKIVKTYSVIALKPYRKGKKSFYR